MADNKEDKPEPKNKKKKKEKDPRKKLNIGHVVRTVKEAYKVESVLGSGGFGDVYQVCPSKKPNTKYAMKTEYFDAQKRKLLNRLKVEMAVFADIQKCASPIDKSHFVHYVDKGKTEVFKFIIMEIVSYSLIDIRTNMMKGMTSNSTTIQIGRQTLQSIEALHYIGYVHRDIKPHNFAIGRPPLDSKIYMLDFGIARKFCDTERRVRIPRKVVRFLGTVKYASRACHNEKEQCRRDDIEVWCYMMLEYFNKDNLRWRRKTDRKEIVALKTELMTNFRSIEPKLLMPKKFSRVLESVESLTYTCIPDFAALHKALDEICKEENIDESEPLDWIGKSMETGKTKKAKADEKLLNCEDTEEARNWDARDKRKRDGAERKRKLEEELARIYKELDENKTPAEIRAEIRSRMRKEREGEKRRRAQERRDDEEEEEGDDSEDDYSDEEDEPRRQSKMLSVMKMLRDEPSRVKYESRKKRTGKRHSREDPDDDFDRRDRHSGNRKKGSRNTQSAYGKMEGQKKKKQSQSRMDKPADSPPLQSVSLKMRSVNDYIVFGSTNDMEKDADAKDKDAAEKKAALKKKEKTSSHNDSQDKK